MKLPPNKCVIRFCRDCGEPMTLSSYTRDLDYRWYEFHCEDCGYDVTLGENITQDTRERNQSNGDYLEPLTKEEMKLQNSPEAKEGERKMFKQIEKNREEERKREKDLEKHRISDEDKKDLK